MPKGELKKIISAFADILKKNRIAFRKIYLYGSYATGKAHEHSDIDVAVVFRRLKRDKGYLDKAMKLRRLSAKVDPRIEPILMEEKDLTEEDVSIMGSEVLKNGILVATG